MKDKKIYFITGSQHLYGDEALKQVAKNGREIAEFLNKQKENPVTIVFWGTVKTPAEITGAVIAAESDADCVGIIAWMHTFSPAKMWIDGLKRLSKPLLHLHTQYNEAIPYGSIDMDFMNLNQSAHGDREFGHIFSRLKISRKVVAGYYKDKETLKAVYDWCKAAAAVDFSKNLKVIRLGDNMRGVAVTEGDKVEAQIKFGWTVDANGLGDLAELIDKVTEKEIKEKLSEYKARYDYDKKDIEAVTEQAKQEIAIRKLADSAGAKAITTNFENLSGLKQLPGLAVQNIMANGFGFGAEGDWKTAALTAVLKYISHGGTSFMEDYTYNLEKGKELVLGAHMLEICPSISKGKPQIIVKPLGIGGKEPPARIVFDAKPGKAVNVSLIDLGNRFRMIVSIVDITEGENMPNLPVAQVLWKPRPSLKTAAEAWIYAGGAHHTVLSTAVSAEQLSDFCDIIGIEMLLIDEKTDINEFKYKLKISDAIWS